MKRAFNALRAFFVGTYPQFIFMQIQSGENNSTLFYMRYSKRSEMTRLFHAEALTATVDLVLEVTHEKLNPGR